MRPDRECTLRPSRSPTSLTFIFPDDIELRIVNGADLIRIVLENDAVITHIL